MEYASALIGIIAFGLEVVEKVHHILEAIKDAPEQLQLLRDRSLDVEFILLQLKQAHDNGELNRMENTPYLSRLRGRSEEQLRKVQQFLDKVVTVRNGGDMQVAKIRWLINHGQFKELLERLEELNVSFTAIMTIAIA